MNDSLIHRPSGSHIDLLSFLRNSRMTFDKARPVAMPATYAATLILVQVAADTVTSFIASWERGELDVS